MFHVNFVRDKPRVREVAICTQQKIDGPNGKLLSSRAELLDKKSAQKLCDRAGMPYQEDKPKYHFRTDDKFRLVSGFRQTTRRTRELSTKRLTELSGALNIPLAPRVK